MLMKFLGGRPAGRTPGFGPGKGGSSPSPPATSPSGNRTSVRVTAARGPRYTEEEARAAIADSLNFSQALRKLGMRPAGGNHATLRRYAEHVWKISTAHFDPHAARRDALRSAHQPRPIEEILVEHSSYCRGSLKKRLFREGLKQPICEICGQGEIWRGRRMSLILDHANGHATDNRLENLRIVCPNCAATLDTHCGKLSRRPRTERPCVNCGSLFYPTNSDQRRCSLQCRGERLSDKRRGIPKPHLRKVERPPYDQLLGEVAEVGYLAVGRRYGVSDNAIRKWLRQYERERSELGEAA